MNRPRHASYHLFKLPNTNLPTTHTCAYCDTAILADSTVLCTKEVAGTDTVINHWNCERADVNFNNPADKQVVLNQQLNDAVPEPPPQPEKPEQTEQPPAEQQPEAENLHTRYLRWFRQRVTRHQETAAQLFPEEAGQPNLNLAFPDVNNVQMLQQLVRLRQDVIWRTPVQSDEELPTFEEDAINTHNNRLPRAR